MWYSQGHNHEAHTIRPWLLDFGGDPLVQTYDVLAMLGEATWGNLPESNKQADLMKTIELWRAESIQRSRERLGREMTAAESRGDTAHIEALAREFQKLREDEAFLQTHAKQKETEKNS